MGTSSRARWWERSCLIAGIVALATVHAPVLGYKKFADVDEAYGAAIAARLLDGAKLYDGAVSQRGPLMYYGYEAMAWLTGWDNVLGWRVWALLFAIAHVVLVYFVGRSLLSRTAGVVAALATVYALAFGLPPRDSFALHGETMQLPALLGSVVVGAWAMRHPPASRARGTRLFASGALAGIAICIKQSAALHPIPLLVWLVASASRNRTPAKRVLVDATTMLAGCALAPIAFVIHAWAQGTLRELYYYCVTYNLSTHLRPTQRSSLWVGAFFERLGSGTLFFMVLVVLAGAALPFVARRVRAAIRARSPRPLARAFGPRTYLALHLLAALAAASSMYRFFPHYYIEALPFMTLLLGAALVRWFHRRALTARVVIAAFAAFLVFFGALTAYFEEKIDGRIAHDGLVERLASYIEQSTSPNDKIFVWGFSPWLYEYSHRRPAGRYVFETYVTGFVPWFWEDPAVEKRRIVPGSVEALLGDLDREQPEIVVDAGAILIGRPMRAYEKTNAWLHANYCFAFRFGAYDVYRKRRGECEVPFFPRMAPPKDFYGSDAWYAVMPITLDYRESQWLSASRYDAPAWFPEQREPAHVDALRDLRLERDRKEWLDKIGVKDEKDLVPPPPCNSGATRP